MGQEVAHEAAVLRAIGYDIILTGADKNPGRFVKDWPTHEWDDAEYARVLKQHPDASLAIRLGEFIDIEIDAEDELTRRNLREAFEEEIGLIKTPHWESRRGCHWLFRLDEVQRHMLRVIECPSVVKANGFEYRLGLRPAQSLLPTPGSDYRKWLLSPAESSVARLPDHLLCSVMAAAPQPKAPTPVKEQATRPGDLFNENGPSWAEILDRHGWKCFNQLGEVAHWTRPGKDTGLSATTGYCGTDNRPDCFYCFSSDEAIAPFESQKTYTRFEAWTTLEFNGDFSAAAAEATRRGFVVDDRPDGSEFDDDLGDYNVLEKTEERIPSPPPSEPERPRLDAQCYGNPIGEYCKELYEHYNIEADPAGILFQAFEIFGNLLGRDVWTVGEDGKIYPNDYLMVVGDRATGRKGTAWGHAKKLFCRDDLPGDETTERFNASFHGRVDSGEGLVKALLNTHGVAGSEFVAELPVRLLIQDSEAIAMLNKSKIENATLQQNLMRCWDGSGVNIAKSKDRAFVKKPHVTVIGHAQPEPLKAVLTAGMDYSGFMSRFQFILVERCRIFYDPPAMDDNEINAYHAAIEASIRWAASGIAMRMSPAAREAMRAFYEGKGDITREHRHVQKTAMRLAALRQSPIISVDDIGTAIRMQQFVGECTHYLFKDWGIRGEQADDEERVAAYVRDNEGTTLTDLSHFVFNRHKRFGAIREIVSALVNKGVIKPVTIKRGRNRTTGWSA